MPELFAAHLKLLVQTRFTEKMNPIVSLTFFNTRNVDYCYIAYHFTQLSALYPPRGAVFVNQSSSHCYTISLKICNLLLL